MSEDELPNYAALLGKGPFSRRLAKRILGDLLKSGRELHAYEREYMEKLFPGKPWNEILKNKSKVFNAVACLIQNYFVEKSLRGPIRLKWRTPLCWLANTPDVPFAYLGLLGRRRYPVSETETAVKLLESDPNVGRIPEKIVVVTTNRVIGEWEDGISSDLKIDWRTCGEDKLNDIDVVKEKVKPLIIELMKNYILIMDLTSGPRPAGVAFHELALECKVPLIYVYEPIKKLRWLISKEKLMKEIGGVFYIVSDEEAEKGRDVARRRKKRIVY